MTKDELISKNIKLAYKLANKYYKMYNNRFEYEEIRSVSFLGLVKAANSFDESKGLAFSTFAFTCIKNEIIYYIRSNLKHNNISLYHELNDNLIIEDTITDDHNIENIILNNMEINDLYHYIEELPKIQKDVIIYHLQGKTTTEIADILGHSQPNISRLYYKALNNLRDKFKD